MATVTYNDALKKEYEDLWATCEIDYQPEIAAQAAARLLKNKGRYQVVQSLTGVPWFWIAIVHEREDGGNFSGVLHNGEHIIGKGTKTRLVPAGRGPFNTWEEAAVDAIKIKGLEKITSWTVGRFWYECERFNGFGYRYKGVPSPYLWSHTNHYKDYPTDADKGGGKYVADHVYDASAHDKQFGCAAILVAMMKQDPSIRMGTTTPIPSVPPVAAEDAPAKTGAVVAAVAAGTAAVITSPDYWQYIVPATIVAIIAGVLIIKWYKNRKT